LALFYYNSALDDKREEMAIAIMHKALYQQLKGDFKMKGFTALPEDRDPKILGIFTKDRQFYRTFFPLLLTISLQQLAAFMVNMVDNIMLGTYSELALSGATLVNQLQFVLQQVASCIGMGIVVLASQYWGQQRIDPIKKIISIGVKCGLAVGAIFFALSVAIPHQLLSVFTSDRTVISEGARYLRVMCWTFLLFSVSNSLMYALQSVETAMIGTLMSISTICINVCLNYCFIYGNFGAPELGIVGAAVATLVSRTVELIIILVYVLFIDKKLRMKLRDLMSFDTTYLKDYIRHFHTGGLERFHVGHSPGRADGGARTYKRSGNRGKRHRGDYFPGFFGLWNVLRKCGFGGDR